MVSAIIFDLYGVLAINGWQAFKEAQFSDREDAWDQVYQLGRQVDNGLIDYTELVRFTAEVTGETEATVRYQLEHTVANAELLKFIHDELKGQYKLAILSNSSQDEVIGRIFTAEQQSLFDAIILSHHLGMTKPDTRMYNAAANKLEVETGDSLFVDDQERHVAGARDAGMHALVYIDIPSLRRTLMELQ